MHTSRNATRIAGVFSLVGIIAGVFSMVYVIEESDYLAKLPTHESQVLVGAFFQLLMVPAYVGVALSLYPILKDYSERLALGIVMNAPLALNEVLLALWLIGKGFNQPLSISNHGSVVRP